MATLELKVRCPKANEATTKKEVTPVSHMSKGKKDKDGKWELYEGRPFGIDIIDGATVYIKSLCIVMPPRQYCWFAGLYWHGIEDSKAMASTRGDTEDEAVDILKRRYLEGPLKDTIPQFQGK